jgi:hypothetical protein
VTSGAVTLDRVAVPALIVQCTRCGRQGRYLVSTVDVTHGSQARLPDVLTAIRRASDCPNREADLTLRCQVCMPELRRPGALR